MISAVIYIVSSATQATCRLVQFDTICLVFKHCLGSFLLQDVLSSLHDFAFGGQT